MGSAFRHETNPHQGMGVREGRGTPNSDSVNGRDDVLVTGNESAPYLMSVTEAARLLGWGRTKLYHAIQRGYFTAGVVHVGTSISISRRALFRWLETVGHGAPPGSTR